MRDGDSGSPKASRANATADTFDFDTVISRRDTASLKWDKYRNTDILPFWVADMDFAVAPAIMTALEARLAHPIFGYTLAPDGLVEAVQHHLASEFDWIVDEDWIVWLPGVVPGLAVSCRAYCAQDDEIIVNPPIYHHFFDSHEPERHSLVRVPLMRVDHRWTWDMPAMRAAVTSRTKMVMLCSPHNPAGTVFTFDELQAMAAFCAEHDLVMISDEIHSGLVIDPAARHLPTAAACADHRDRIVTLMSGSKTWNIAGLNCSFAIIPDPTLREQFKQASQSILPGVPPLAYEATLAAYRDGGPWRQALLRYLADNFAYLQEEINSLPGLTLEPMQASYLAWIDATKLGLDDTQGWLESHGLGLNSGEGFGQPQFVRLNFACPRVTLEEGVRRLRAAVASLST